MFAVIRKSAVVPPHADNLDADVWGQKEDIEEATHAVHEGLGVPHPQPRDIAAQLAELVAHHAPLDEAHAVDGSFAVCSDAYQLRRGKTGAGEEFVVLMEGAVTNGAELFELYDMDPASLPGGAAAMPDGADLLVQLYGRGFADRDGDWSDQPATVLRAMKGDFAFVVYDPAAGYILAARSDTGRAHMYWGLDRREDTLVFATAQADAAPGVGHLSDFPRGCFFESQLVEGQGDSNLATYVKEGPTGRALEATLRVDSRGHLCAMRFRTKSGVDLPIDDDDRPLPPPPAH